MAKDGRVIFIFVAVTVSVLVTVIGWNVFSRKHERHVLLFNNKCGAPQIYVRANDLFGFPHFAHVMEYCYFFTDIILQNADTTVIVELPTNAYRSPYVDAFLGALKNTIGYVEKNNVNILSHTPVREFSHVGAVNLELPYIFNGKQVKSDYLEWFKYPNTSNIMRDLLVQPSIPQDKLTIGLVNRKLQSGRHLLNADTICGAIKNKFGIEVEQTFFENTTFDYQMQFFRNHKVLLGPHGAHLVNIPFLPDDALIIEYCDEWQPYSYFSGLAYTTSKYHVVIRPSHGNFPDYSGQSNNKENMHGDVDKTLQSIETYMQGSETLPSHFTYLE